MKIKGLARRLTDNDYVFTIFTKVMAVFIGLIASSYSNRFLGPELKGQLGQINSLLSIVAVTANFGLYQPYPYYTRQGGADTLDRFLRIFMLQFIAYTALGVLGALSNLPITSGIVARFPWLDVGVPALTGLYFDWFGGCIQAFIFCTLTTLFIKQAAGDD